MNSQIFFISVPYIASLLLLTVSFLSQTMFSLTISIDPFIERIAVSVFLFSIGFQIATVYTKLHVKRLLILTGICIVLLISLHGMSFIFGNELKWLAGPIMFAFNDELFYRVITEKQDISFIYFWSKIQMIVIFVLTPVFILLISSVHPKKGSISPIKNNEIISFKGHYSILVILLSVMAVYLKNEWLKDTIPFFYDFVITMLIGIGIGLWSKQNVIEEKKMKLNNQFHQVGTFGLYTFILSSIYSVIFIDFYLFSWNFFLFIIVKFYPQCSGNLYARNEDSHQ